MNLLSGIRRLWIHRLRSGVGTGFVPMEFSSQLAGANRVTTWIVVKRPFQTTVERDPIS